MKTKEEIDAIRDLIIEELRYKYNEKHDALKQKCEPLYDKIVSKFNVAIEEATETEIASEFILKPCIYEVSCNGKQITTISKARCSDVNKSFVLTQLAMHKYPKELTELQVYRSFNHLIEPFLYMMLIKDEGYVRNHSISYICMDFVDYVEKYNE